MLPDAEYREIFMKNMCRADLEDEVMILRAQNKAQDNEIMNLRQQLAALTCACCDPPAPAPVSEIDPDADGGRYFTTRPYYPW